MQLTSFTQQIVDLTNQNGQLKTKYKKSLQELMHILSINKTMKEHMDNCSNNQTKINELQFSIEDLNLKLEMQKMQIKEVVGIKSGLQVRVATLQVVNKDAEIEKQRLKNQLAQILKRLKVYEEKRKQLEHQEQVSNNKIKMPEEMEHLKVMNEKLSKAVIKFRGIQQQNLKFSNKIEELQEEIKVIINKQNDQRQRWKNKISVLQDEVATIRSSQLQKTRQIQYKYSILQAQMSNYRRIEDKIEESRRIDQDQILFKSIQQQIQKINENISVCQNHNSDLIAKSREEEQIRIKSIAELQSRIQKYQLESEHYKQKADKLESKIQLIKILQDKLKAVSDQKLQLLQRNNVLQTMMIAKKHRLGYEVAENIEEFERNINLLLQQDVKSMSNLGGIQQIIVLKGYVKELSDLLQSQKKKVDKLRKRNEQLKIRMKDIEFQNTLQKTQFDKKIANYEQLIEKQYVLLEEKILETQNMGKERDYSNAISKYEQKMLKMSDQIIKLKRKNEYLQQVNKSKVVPWASQQEFERLNNVVNSLQKDLERIQTQNREMFEENKSLIEINKNEGNQAKSIIKQKEQKIVEILQKIAWYQEEIKTKQQKINSYIEMNKSYEKQMKVLHDQLQEHIATNNYLHNKYKDTDILLEKVANLEAELNELKRSQQAAIEYQSSKLVEHLQQLENKISLQTQQIDAYKQENTLIYNELNSSKQDKQSMLLQHKSIVAKLTSRIVDLQVTLKEENILKMQQQQKNTDLKLQCEKLKQQNKTLALQIQTLTQEMQAKRLAFENQINSLKKAKQDSQSEQSHPKLLHKSSKQIKQFNSKLLSLRTQNLAIKNELQEKEATISELKHQIYTRQLKMQKHKSRQNLLIGKQISEKNNQEYQKLLFAFTIVSAQLDAIRTRQATVETEVQTFEDRVIEQDFQQQINQINITSLDYQQNEGTTKINIVAQPLNLELQTLKSINTVNEPISVIDSKWKEQYEKRKQKQQSENGIKDYHSSAGSFKMIKLLKKSLKSIENESSKKGESLTRQ